MTQQVVDQDTGEIQVLTDLTDDALLEEFARAKAFKDQFTRQAGQVEQELYRRMEERGATGIRGTEFICEKTVANTYAQGLLTELKVELDSADLEIVLTPAHPETVPDKWEIQKLTALVTRLGGKPLRIFENAREPGRTSLKFEQRK